MRIAIGVVGVFLAAISCFAMLGSPRTLRPGWLLVSERSLSIGGPGTSSDVQHALFRLKNEGGTTIRLSTPESGCGCTSVELSANLLRPGEVATLDAAAQPLPVGEKVVRIVLRTDSQLTPEVAVQLHILGTRSPPFLNRVVGDLAFRGTFNPAETREILVETIEGSNPSPDPTLKCDVPLLRFELLRRDEAKNGFLKGTVHRARFYRASFASRPGNADSTGALTIRDPWDAGHSMSLPISISWTPALKVSPARLDLDFDASGKLAGAASFLVSSREKAARVRIEAKGSSVAPLEIVAGSGNGATGFHTYTIRLRRGMKAVEGETEFRIWTEDPEAETSIRVQLRSAKP